MEVDHGALACVLLALALSLGAAPSEAAEGDPGGFTNPVFDVFTRIYRKAEGSVVSVRTSRGVSAGVREQLREVERAESGSETAFRLVKLSLALPLYLAQSSLSFMLSPLSGGSGERGEGSGFIVDQSGLVLTNLHVIQGAERIEVRFVNDRSERATVRATDPALDLALLEITRSDEKREYPAVTLGSSSELAPGQWVMAIGSPYGLEQSVTVGVVSAPLRHIGPNVYDQYIQLDATVNPGSSGGPLFDPSGRVVGMTTAAVEASAGIGFAVPIQAIEAVLPVLERGQTPRRGGIGITVAPATAAEFAEYGLDREPGLWVRSVAAGSAAEAAGVAAGDLMVMVAGHPTRSLESFETAQRDLIVGQPTTVAVWRDGIVQSLPITPRVRNDVRTGKE